MTKLSKRTLFAVALMCFALSFGLLFAENGKVKADGVVPYFYMTEGAYIRPTGENLGGASDQNGIRFETNVSETYAESVAEDAGFTDYETEYFTLIGKNVVLDALIYDNIGDNGGNKVIKKTWTPVFDGNGTYVRKTDLLNFADEMFATAFTVRSGIRLTQDGKVPVTVYAAGSDLTRTMEGCAIAAITADPTVYNDYKNYIGLTGGYANDFSVD